MKAGYLFVMTFFLLNCSKQSETGHSTLDQVSDPATPTVELSQKQTVDVDFDPKKFDERIGQVSGLLVLREGYSKPNDFIRLYNEDGSLWFEFTYYYDDSDGKYDYENDSFGPYAFHPDYFLLALSVVGEKAKYYEVIANEETKLRKYVKKNEKNLKFETWQEHILNTFSIEFDKEDNPLRKAPNGGIREVDDSKIDRYWAEEFRGDWLKVKWDRERNPTNDPKLTEKGWIRWKNGDRLLIRWFYIS